MGDQSGGRDGGPDGGAPGGDSSDADGTDGHVSDADGTDGAGPKDDRPANDGPDDDRPNDDRPANDGPDAAGHDVVESGDGAPDEFDEHRPCPECDESLPADARFCPYCETAIDEDGAAVDLSGLEGFDPDEIPELLSVDDGERRASGRVRALAGLAVAVPLAPLVLFLVNSLVSLTVWTAPVVFLAAWLCCGAVLSRAPVPVLAFGRSLYLLALGTALIPVALVVGDAGFAAEPADTTFRVVAVGSMVIAGAFLWLGRYVSAQGRRRVTGERRAFEDLREE